MRTKITLAFGVVTVLPTCWGCSARVINVSRELTIPTAADFSLIRAKILVTCEDPLSIAHEDVAAKLTENVFIQATARSNPEDVSDTDVELLVNARIVERSHHAEEMGERWREDCSSGWQTARSLTGTIIP